MSPADVYQLRAGRRAGLARHVASGGKAAGVGRVYWLQEIVRLVGQDALSPADRLTMETAKMIREDFLQQNAFIDEDAYSSYLKQFRLLDMVLQYDTVCREAIGAGADMNKLFNIPARERIGRAKMVPQDEVVKTYDGIIEEMKAEVAEIAEGGEDE